MEPTIVQGSPATTGNVHFLNIEYFFYQFYSWTHGGAGAGAGGELAFASLITSLTTVWIAITIIAYLISAGAIAFLVYTTTRKAQVLASEEAKYATFVSAERAEDEVEHHRWKHVRELVESASPNDWRQAIIEADIILEDMLRNMGLPGNSVGEKLKAANPAHFKTLQEAWEAHKVRNDIAHQGSEFPLTDRIAYRTILHYENVFREHGEI